MPVLFVVNKNTIIFTLGEGCYAMYGSAAMNLPINWLI